MEARRVALRAQGFGSAPPVLGDTRALMRVFDQIGLIQIDSVNVIVRSHYFPLFSRLGAYDVKLLERLVWEKRGRKLFEYWGHEASLNPLTLHPLFRWRMARAERTWGRIATIARDKPDFVGAILREVQQRGPLASGDIAEHRSTGGGWWGWSEVKVALEYLFWSGAVTTAKRRNFERLYDLPERVFAPAILAAPTPDEASAKRELLRIAARALGIATRPDLCDYFRLVADANERIEIYTPAPKRVHGYYVLPFLHGDRLAARVDAKARRDERVLDVIAVHYEDARPAIDLRDDLRTALHALATWLGLEKVVFRRVPA